MLQYSKKDAWLVGASFVHATLLCLCFVYAQKVWSPILLTFLMSLGLCWSANTVSHNHIHNPFFRSKTLNRGFSYLLTAVLGLSQTFWKEKHLWHHAGEPATKNFLQPNRKKLTEVAFLLLLWSLLVFFQPFLFFFVYLPAYLVGLGLCALQGHFEHHQEQEQTAGISTYGRLYNKLWFNDGFHREHHKHPRLHWSKLPQVRLNELSDTSSFAPQIRWMESMSKKQNAWIAGILNKLELLPLHFLWFEKFMLESHTKALRSLLPKKHYQAHICVVGGGLYPRTILALKNISPHFQITVFEQSSEHIQCAKAYLAKKNISSQEIHFIEATFDQQQAKHASFDAVILPLAFVGNKQSFENIERSWDLISHEWCWSQRGTHSRMISCWLMKRLCFHQRNVQAS